MSQAKEFLKALVTDAKAKELLKNMKEPSTVEEAADEYIGLAKELGFADVTKENILAFLKAEEKNLKEKAEKNAELVREPLDDKDLEAVSGGTDGCQDTFRPGEWCTITDSCSYVIRYYDGTASNEDVEWYWRSDSTWVDGKDLPDSMKKEGKQYNGMDDWDMWLNPQEVTDAFLNDK